jgi:hypothetical protein
LERKKRIRLAMLHQPFFMCLLAAMSECCSFWGHSRSFGSDLFGLKLGYCFKRNFKFLTTV